jgi:hypothetical protein
MSNNFNIDVSKFMSRLNLADKKIQDALRIGSGQAGLMLMRDCVMEAPTVPHKEGVLRGSGSVFVDNKFIGSSESLGKKGTPNKNNTGEISIGDKKIVVTVGYNTPYAHRQHEGVDFKFSEPSSGAKFLESKLIRFGKEYYQVITDKIKEVLG